MEQFHLMLRQYRAKCSKFLVVMILASGAFITWCVLYWIFYELSLKEDIASTGASVVIFSCIIMCAWAAYRRNARNNILPTMISLSDRHMISLSVQQMESLSSENYENKERSILE